MKSNSELATTSASTSTSTSTSASMDEQLLILVEKLNKLELSLLQIEEKLAKIANKPKVKKIRVVVKMNQEQPAFEPILPPGKETYNYEDYFS